MRQAVWFPYDWNHKAEWNAAVARDETGQTYDLGTVRSHRDYEIYAGIDFAGRRLHRDTVKGVEPPCVYENEEQWQGSFVLHHRLDLKWNVGDLEPCEDLNFLYFAIEDAAGQVLHRYDAPADSDEGRRLASTRKVEFSSNTRPAKLVAWPVSQSRGWLKKVEYAL